MTMTTSNSTATTPRARRGKPEKLGAASRGMRYFSATAQVTCRHCKGAKGMYVRGHWQACVSCGGRGTLQERCAPPLTRRQQQCVVAVARTGGHGAVHQEEDGHYRITLHTGSLQSGTGRQLAGPLLLGQYVTREAAQRQVQSVLDLAALNGLREFRVDTPSPVGEATMHKN